MRFFLFTFIGILLIGCNNQPTPSNIPIKQEYSFHIPPTKVQKTPDRWEFKNKAIEAPFLLYQEENFLAGVVFFKNNKAKAKLNIITHLDTNTSQYGNWDITNCNNTTELKYDEYPDHVIIEAECVSVNTFNSKDLQWQK